MSRSRTLNFLLLLSALLLCSLHADAARIGDPFPGVAGSSLLILNDRPLWAHFPDKPFPPASLTKLMTALLVMENLRKGKTAIVPTSVAQETGSKIGLAPGEQIGIPELLAAALMSSANDASLTLAIHVAGSEERFVELMNRRAVALGLTGTHFTNACGHDAPGHRSTATDLAVLFRRVYAYPAVAAIMATESMLIKSSDGRKKYLLKSSNAMLGRYPGILGGKTGTTEKAGRCLIVLAGAGSDTALLVLLNARDRWWDAEHLLDAAFRVAATDRRQP